MQRRVPPPTLRPCVFALASVMNLPSSFPSPTALSSSHSWTSPHPSPRFRTSHLQTTHSSPSHRHILNLYLYLHPMPQSPFSTPGRPHPKRPSCTAMRSDDIGYSMLQIRISIMFAGSCAHRSSLELTSPPRPRFNLDLLDVDVDHELGLGLGKGGRYDYARYRICTRIPSLGRWSRFRRCEAGGSSTTT